MCAQFDIIYAYSVIDMWDCAMLYSVHYKTALGVALEYIHPPDVSSRRVVSGMCTELRECSIS